MRALSRLSVVVGGILLVGCYELQPTGGSVPQPGTIIGLDINDAGRVALGGAMGTEIGQIEGRLIEKTATEYVVGVTVVHLLRGGEQVWRGENVRVRSDYVTTIYQRRLNPARTAVLAAAGAGA